MTHHIDSMANEQEARMQEAIAAVKNGKYMAYTAACVFNVSKRILYSHVNTNVQPRNLAHEHDQNLTHAEEKELV